MKVTIAGKTYSAEFLGLKEGDMIRIGRTWMNEPRLQKLNRETGDWDLVDHPENHGHPSIQIDYLGMKNNSNDQSQQSINSQP